MEGGPNNKELKVEEINVGKERKVWLIIAKGQESIYLIPAVRSSGLGESQAQRRSGLNDKDERKVWDEGVEDLKSWTNEFDKREDWEQDCNENLRRKYKSGIVISRGGSILDKQDEKVSEWRRKGGKLLFYKGEREEAKEWNKEEKGRDEVRLWRNAGWIRGNTLHRRNGKCAKDEKYFPLDIAVLGNSKKIENKSSSSRSLIQEIEIKDTITQVIGVRLDQVVINETGIGDGAENQIDWDTVPKPSLIRELLK